MTDTKTKDDPKAEQPKVPEKKAPAKPAAKKSPARKPAAKKQAEAKKPAVEREREKLDKEFAELQESNEKRLLEHNLSEVHSDVPASDVKGDKDKVVEVHAFGGHVYINSHGEARLDSTQALALRTQVDVAWRAVT